jgi:hypothetical protein
MGNNSRLWAALLPVCLPVREGMRDTFTHRAGRLTMRDRPGAAAGEPADPGV